MKDALNFLSFLPSFTFVHSLFVDFICNFIVDRYATARYARDSTLFASLVCLLLEYRPGLRYSLRYSLLLRFEFMGAARVTRRACLPQFLENIVILCFERPYPKQNSVIRLKSNVSASPQFFCPPNIFGLATLLFEFTTTIIARCKVVLKL